MKLTTIDKPVFDKKDFVKVLKEGDYFKMMDEAIRNSPTASMAVLMFKKYCKLPNLKPEYTKLWDKIVDEKIKYGFFTLWIEYNSDLKVKQAHFRPDKNYVPKERDDIGEISQYLNTRTKKDFPSFNSDPLIVAKQVETAGGFGKYNGQVFQYNTTTDEYELSVFVPVFNWMGIEEDTPTHVVSAADNALFGNSIFIMAKGAESSSGPDDENKKLSNTDKVLNALKQSKSTKKTGTNHILTVDTEKDLDKIFYKVPVGNDVNIDQFNAVDDKASKKICNAAYCFPQILANPDAGLFGNSGEAYRAALEIWEETCYFEALKIEQAFTEIGIAIQTVNAAEENQEDEDNAEDPATLEAQATLRGSAEAVTKILEIQAALKEGKTTEKGALAMIRYIFGFDDAKAAELLGIETVPEVKPVTLN
jgi:hypothetical protein